jgi:hypothetical protein
VKDAPIATVRRVWPVIGYGLMLFSLFIGFLFIRDSTRLELLKQLHKLLTMISHYPATASALQ